MTTIAHAEEILTLLDEAEHTLTLFVEAQTAKAVRRAIDTRAAKLQTELAKLFRIQGNAVVRALTSLKKSFTEDAGDDFDNLFDGAILDSSARMQEAIDTAIKAALLDGARNLISEFSSNIVFSLTNPRAVAYTSQYAANLITGIDSTTRDQLRRLVEVAVANGTPYTTLANQIKARYQEFAIGVPQRHLRSRAELVAVTEVGNAYQEGNLIAARLMGEKGIKLEKLWQTVGDRRVSAGCITNNRAGWIEASADFPSGDQRPLRFPGCRCAALYRRAR